MDLKWQLIKEHPPEVLDAFARQLNANNRLLATVLLNRGLSDADAARRFFLPGIQHLHDPFLLSGMKTAVERISVALERGEKILVYGDYDVDGTTATSMLILFFREIGHRVEFYIPDRLSEGYGLSKNGLDTAKERGCSVVITVDCGISAIDAVDYATSLGLDVIICDHHQPGDCLPNAVAILNPKKPDCPYPFKELAGVGVAFKLAQAICRHLEHGDHLLHKYLSLVAIGSAADIVPLVDENRFFVKFGLRLLGESTNIGMRALLESTGLVDKNLGTGQVVFVIAPRINAVGRMGDAGRAVRLLTTQDTSEAKRLASELEQENRIRKDIDSQTLTDALELIEKDVDPETDYVYVLSNNGWHPGVIGIVASRVVERYFRPTVMIATDNGIGKGSARSIPGFDIYDALKACEDLMESFGGHKYAAGLTLATDKIPELRERLNAHASKHLTKESLTPKLWVDAEICLSDLDAPSLKLLNKMAPYGPQNSRPVFLSKGLQVVGSPRVVGNNHLKFSVRQDNVVMDAIGFELGELLYRISDNASDLDMIYTVEENEWNDRVTVQLRVKDLR